MKRQLSFFIVGFTLALPCLHLTKMANAISSTTSSKEKIKIGFLLANLREERYKKDENFFLKEAEALGFEPVISSSDNSDYVQSLRVENLISQGVRVLVVQPVNSAHAAGIVKAAHRENVAVVSYDRMIQDAPVDFHVTQDSFQVGVLQAEAAVKATHKKGNYIILMGQEGSSVAEEITRGILSVLGGCPGIKIIDRRYHEKWAPALAMATVESILKKKKTAIHAVLANNSGLAQGAIQALAEHDLVGKVFVAGADADLAAIKDLVGGRQQFEVLKDIEPLAKAAARVAFQLARGEKPQGQPQRSFLHPAKKQRDQMDSGVFSIPFIATDVYGVTKDNLESVIFARGFHHREDVYGHH